MFSPMQAPQLLVQIPWAQVSCLCGFSCHDLDSLLLIKSLLSLFDWTPGTQTGSACLATTHELLDMGYLFHHKGIFLMHLWLISLAAFSVNLLTLHPATSPHYLLSSPFLYNSNAVPSLFITIRWPMAPTFTAHLASGNDLFPPSGVERQVWRQHVMLS